MSKWLDETEAYLAVVCWVLLIIGLAGMAVGIWQGVLDGAFRSWP